MNRFVNIMTTWVRPETILIIDVIGGFRSDGQVAETREEMQLLDHADSYRPMIRVVTEDGRSKEILGPQSSKEAAYEMTCEWATRINSELPS